MKKTFRQIRQFNIAVDQFLKKEKKETKLVYAIKRVSERDIEPITKEYQKEISNLWRNIVEKSYIENALTDKTTGEVLISSAGSLRPYKFDKKGLASVLDAEASFEEEREKFLEDYDKKEFEIEGFKVKEIPELSDSEKEAFTGFVI